MLDSAKSAIRANFHRAAGSYDDAAEVQKQACHKLLQGLEPCSLPTNLRMLDAGCGTGWGALLFKQRFPQAHISLLDFAAGMARAASQSGYPTCVADMEALPFASRVFDVWWSNMAVQWCHLPTVLSEAQRVLKLGGVLACSTLLAGTFAEMAAAFQAIDRYQHMLTFQTQQHIESALQQTSLIPLSMVEHPVTLFYPDLKTLLRSIQAVGANKVLNGARTGLMSRKQWHALECAYETHRTAAGLPLTYRLLFFYASAPVYM